MASTIILRDRQGGEHPVEVEPNGSVRVDSQQLAVVWARAGEVRVGGRTVWVAANGHVRWVFLDGQVYIFDSLAAASPVRRASRHEGGLSAPMPATVLKIQVSPGDRVRAGEPLIILEAMKMELPVRAPADGVVGSVRCREGELVQPGQDLIEVIPVEPPNEPEGTQ